MRTIDADALIESLRKSDCEQCPEWFGTDCRLNIEDDVPAFCYINIIVDRINKHVESCGIMGIDETKLSNQPRIPDEVYEKLGMI